MTFTARASALVSWRGLGFAGAALAVAGCQLDTREIVASSALQPSGAGGEMGVAGASSNAGSGGTVLDPSDGEGEGGEPDTVIIPDGGLIDSTDGPGIGDTCVTGERSCSGGDRLLECQSGAFVEIEVCPFVCLTSAEGAGCGGECKPGASSCSTDGTPIGCDEAGQLLPQAPCTDATPSCVDGTCRACLEGERRCSAEGIPEVCAAGGGAWSPEPACEGELICVPETGLCGQCSSGSTRACVGELGNCAEGTQACGNDSAWGPCSIQPAAEDTCTPGDDADCDGQPNEGCECTDAVSCGPAAAIGICRPGTAACIGGTPGACQGAVFASSRNCASSADNDCNGVPDNTIDATCQCVPGQQQDCDQHPGLDGVGICSAGRRSCIAAAGNLSTNFGVCQGSVGPRTRDCRSANDNDCNGVPDNRIDATCQCVPGQQQDCGIEAGSLGCSRGVQTCEAVNGGAQSRFGACVFTDVANGTSCNDGNAQTVADSCQAGSCAGAQRGLLATGPFGACAVRSGGAVYCWSGASAPARVDLPRAALSVSVGDAHACAVMDDRSVRCWGNNGLGTLGNGTTDPVAGSALVSNLSGAIQVAAGSANTAAVTSGGLVFLWGGYDVGATQRELYGVDAPPLTFAVTTPVAIGDLGQVRQFSLGFRHACALLGSGQVVCWGRNDFSQLGRASLGTNDVQAATVLVNSVTDGVGVGCGDSYSCALRAGGTVVCWGSLFTSDLSNTINLPPAEVPQLSGVADISLGSSSACAQRRDGTVACWGGNALGELGTGSFNGTLIPQTVSGVNGGSLNDVALLGTTSALGGRSVCALRRNQSVACWGEGFGATPVLVAGLPQ